ncbi:MAG: hypothetical protein KKB34_18890 [Bacteroidetes bacterium]|nr:hypothetical protein [Bacteroidota bacterium]
MTINKKLWPIKNGLSIEDFQLVEATRKIILEKACAGKHHIACGLRTTKKELFFGLHLSASIGVGSICAEAVAISISQIHGNNEIEAIVSIRHCFDDNENVEIVAPCGRCREIILEYGKYAKIILSENDKLFLSVVKSMIPFPFIRRKSK